MTHSILHRRWLGFVACSAVAVAASSCREGGNQRLRIKALETEVTMPVGESRVVAVETEGSDWQDNLGNEFRVTLDLKSQDESIAIVTGLDPEFHDLTPDLLQETLVTIECVGEGETPIFLDAITNPRGDVEYDNDRINVTCFIDGVSTGTTTDDTMTPTDPSTTGMETTMTPMTDESGSGETGAVPSCRMGEATAPDSNGLILLEGTRVEVPISGNQDDCPTMGCSILITNGHFAEIAVSITPWSPGDSPRPEESLIHPQPGETAEVFVVVDDCVNEDLDDTKRACFFDDFNGLSFGCIDLELASVLQ